MNKHYIIFWLSVGFIFGAQFGMLIGYAVTTLIRDQVDKWSNKIRVKFIRLIEGRK